MVGVKNLGSVKRKETRRDRRKFEETRGKGVIDNSRSTGCAPLSFPASLDQPPTTRPRRLPVCFRLRGRSATHGRQRRSRRACGGTPGIAVTRPPAGLEGPSPLFVNVAGLHPATDTGPVPPRWANLVEYVVKDVPWLYLDTAGPTFRRTADVYRPRGAQNWGPTVSADC